MNCQYNHNGLCWGQMGAPECCFDLDDTCKSFMPNKKEREIKNMEETLTIKLDNLSDADRETLMGLIKKVNNPKRGWKPKSGEKYFYINDDGLTARGIYTDSSIDNFRIRIGNCTRTCDEISEKRECVYINKELQNYADGHNEVEIDWKNGVQDKYYINYIVRDNTFFYNYSQIFKNANTVYFTSEQICRDAVESVGKDRIKKHLFGVE